MLRIDAPRNRNRFLSFSFVKFQMHSGLRWHSICKTDIKTRRSYSCCNVETRWFSRTVYFPRTTSITDYKNSLFVAFVSISEHTFTSQPLLYLIRLFIYLFLIEQRCCNFGYIATNSRVIKVVMNWGFLDISQRCS